MSSLISEILLAAKSYVSVFIICTLPKSKPKIRSDFSPSITLLTNFFFFTSSGLGWGLGAGLGLAAAADANDVCGPLPLPPPRFFAYTNPPQWRP
jgi:hypothetical protein